MKISNIIQILEHWAPPQLQESYDNSRLIVGDASRQCTSVLISLDCTEEIVAEAIERGCNMIVSHHPILFSPIKSLTGKTYQERTLIKAIEHKIALYAFHTNLDNVFDGVNRKIAEKIGLIGQEILRPVSGKLLKLATYVPLDHLTRVRDALFSVGAGHIGNYDQCSFSSSGTGTFRPLEGANPFSGHKNQLQQEAEIKLELIFPFYLKQQIIDTLLDVHPYEEVAYDLFILENSIRTVGAGLLGFLNSPVPFMDFLENIKSVFGGMVRYTKPTREYIEAVALCGGSGSFLIKDAIQANADVFISSDIKYHQFFDHENKITLIDIGHYEAEQFTSELIQRYLIEKIPNFAVLLTRLSTNPIQYL